MPFHLDIPIYSGPMDLLLHVVRKNRIDLIELPLAAIAESFLGYARQTPDLDLEEAGEVILTASLLLRMKVKFLLPDLNAADENDNGRKDSVFDEELEEVFAGIVVAARELADNEARQRLHFTRGKAAGQVEVDETESLLQDVTVLQLAEAFRNLERSLEKAPSRQLALFKVSIEDQAALILGSLMQSSKVSFQQLAALLQTRIEVVVTFLALLDLLRHRRIRLEQEELFSEIWILRGAEFDNGRARKAVNEELAS